MQEYVSAVKTLLKVANGRSLDQAFSSADSPLSRQISYGVLRHYYSLSAYLEQLLSKPLADKHQDIELLILAGIYSIDDLNRPAHASVNFAVDAAAALKKPWAKKLTNGVLRNYQRKKETLASAISSDREAQTNHPEWLIDRLEMAYGADASKIMVANQCEPPMTLRVNQKKTDRDQYLALLNEAAIEATPGKLTPNSLYLKTPVGVERLPKFHEGWVSIQDEASQLVTLLLDPKDGQHILDACAAPGGKTTAILEATNDISMCALDKDPKRTRLITENLERLNLNCGVKSEDLLNHETGTPYDRILLDVPCSATGIIRRHPDIKLLRLDTDIAKLASTQKALLAKAWSLLSVNGELLYSTCSILPDENLDIVRQFVADQPNATIVPLSPQPLASSISYPEGLQLLPETGGTDGFFFSRIKKTSP